MSKTKKIAILAIIAMVLTLMPTALFAATADSTRLEGTGRIGTALDIASAGTWGTSVVLAPADDANLVDALAAAPLAGQENAPILLTFKGSLDAAVKAKIVELKATKVYVVGAISDAVAAEVDAIAGVTVEALKGAGRQATADAVNAKLTNVAGTFVVGFDAVPDALSVASFAAKNKYKIVLANADGTVDSAKLAGTKYIVGGTTKVKDIADAKRLSGIDRFATNADVAKQLSYSYDRVYVANGISCVDALAVAPLAAKYGAFVVLASASDVTGPAGVTGSTKVIAVGGVNAVSDALKAKVYVAPATLAVESVSAINASQFKVVFSKEVDKYSAEDEAKYSVNGTPLVTNTDLAKLQADKKSVIVTVNTAFVNDLAYSVTVDGVLDASNVAVKAPKYVASFLMNDKTVPTISKVTAAANTTTTEVTVEFSEPVGVLGGVLIGGQTASVKTGVGTIASGNSAKVTLTSAQALEVGKTYTITFNSIADRATTANTASVFAPVTTSFTVVTDTAGATIAGIAQVADNMVEVTFNEDVDATSGVFVVDATGIASGTITATGAADDGNKKNVIDVTLTGLSYPSTNVRTILVDVKGVKDTAGNMMAESLDNVVTMTKDTTKPTYKSYTIDSATNQKILVEFSEKLASTAPAMTNYTLVDKDGIDVTATYITGGSSKVVKADRVTAGVGQYLEINLAAALPAGTYSLTIKSSTVTDSSTATNALDAVTFAVTSGSISDTATFTATFATIGANKYTVTYSKEVKGGAVSGSATDPNNYMLGASALPAGTSISLDATKKIATITLSDGTIPETKVETLTVSGVKSLGGGTVTTASASVAVTDNSKPTLVSAKAKSATTIELTYSEPVTYAGFTAGEVVVTNGLDYVDQNATAVSVAGKVITLTVPTMAGINQNYLKVTIAADEVADIAGAKAAKVSDFAVTDNFVSKFAITSLADFDNGVAVNGGDITINYTALTDKDIKEYKLFLFTTDPVATKVSDLDSYVYAWKGTTLPGSGSQFASTIVLDSHGVALTNVAYTAYIVTYDNNGNSSISASATVTLDLL